MRISIMRGHISIMCGHISVMWWHISIMYWHISIMCGHISIMRWQDLLCSSSFRMCGEPAWEIWGELEKGGFERSFDFCLSQHPSSIGCIHSAIFKFCLILLPMAGWCPALHSCGNPEFNQKLEGKHCQAVFKF